MEIYGEAILFISQNMISKGVDAVEVATTVVTVDMELEAENRSHEEVEVLEEEGFQVGHGQELISAEEIGARILRDLVDEDAVDATGLSGSKRRRRTKEQFNSREALYLSLYVSGKKCRRAVWNEFFGNQRKRTF
jgi:hypothetical protein